MTPHTNANETAMPPVTTPMPFTNTDIQLAVLTEKVTQVIGNHEQRITNLENRGKGWPAILTAIIGAVTLTIVIAIRIPWNG